MKLEEVKETNINIYKNFEEANDLNEYMSRIYPNKKADFIMWYYIIEDNKYIGAIWLEKCSMDNFAKLGIFIADLDYRHKGIGTKAIKECINKNKSIKKFRLNVRKNNVNALECYKRIGFKELLRFTKDNGVDVIQMELNINN